MTDHRVYRGHLANGRPQAKCICGWQATGQDALTDHEQEATSGQQ